jgi:hypothetical protein
LRKSFETITLKALEIGASVKDAKKRVNDVQEWIDWNESEATSQQIDIKRSEVKKVIAICKLQCAESEAKWEFPISDRPTPFG